MNEGSQSSYKDKEYPIICLLCGNKFVPCEELVNHLIKWQTAFFITPHNHRKQLVLFTCQVCDYDDLQQDSMREHVIDHFCSKEVLFCNICQEVANQLTLGFIDKYKEPSVSYSTLLNKRKKMVHYTLKHAPPLIPYCSLCNHPFGYVVPVLNRIIQRSSGQGYECNLCDATGHHANDMLKHALLHVEGKELFCMDCLNHCKTKEEIYFPSCAEKAHTERKGTFQPEISLPSKSELQYLKDELIKATNLPPPYPQVSEDESSSHLYETAHQESDEGNTVRNKIRRKKLKSQRKGNRFEEANSSNEPSCVTCIQQVIGRTIRLSSSNGCIFVCQKCRRELGGWAYARESIVKRKHVEEDENKDTVYFSCQICESQFHTWATMESHILSHLEGRQIYCPKCLRKINYNKGKSEKRTQ